MPEQDEKKITNHNQGYGPGEPHHPGEDQANAENDLFVRNTIARRVEIFNGQPLDEWPGPVGNAFVEAEGYDGDLLTDDTIEQIVVPTELQELINTTVERVDQAQDHYAVPPGTLAEAVKKRRDATARPLSEVIANSATRSDSVEWSTVLVNRAGGEVAEIETKLAKQRVDLDRWFTVRVHDAFKTFSGDVLAGALYQLTLSCEVGLDAIEQQAAEKIARRAVSL